jgi:threonine dehydratase
VTTDSISGLSLANIETAARVIDPVFRNSPQFVDEQLCAGLGRRTLVKVETLNPIRSFKGRGADFLMRSIPTNQKVVCASAGNFGQAVAYAGRTRGIMVEVFVASDVNPMKADRMKSFGATVTFALMPMNTESSLSKTESTRPLVKELEPLRWSYSMGIVSTLSWYRSVTEL